MASEKPTQIETSKISCEGGDGPLGHPRVFLKIGDDGLAVCPYCSNRFELAEVSAEALDH